MKQCLDGKRLDIGRKNHIIKSKNPLKKNSAWAEVNQYGGQSDRKRRLRRVW